MRHVRAHVLICAGTGCVSSGSKAVETALIAELEKRGLDKEIKVIETGCHGFCEMGPIMIVYPEGVFYSGVKESDVYELVEEHLLKGRIVERLLYKDPVTLEKIPNYQDMNLLKLVLTMILVVMMKYVIWRIP